jgi:Patatin phospholipase
MGDGKAARRPARDGRRSTVTGHTDSDNENHPKDVDFTPAGIGKRWEAGHVATPQAPEQRPWERERDPLEGVVLHEQMMQDSRLAAE